MGEKLLISLAYNNIGVIMGRRKTWKKSVQNFNNSIRIAGEIGSVGRSADTYFDYAKMLKTKGDFVKAKTQLQNALKCYEKLGNKQKIKEIMDVISVLSYYGKR